MIIKSKGKRVVITTILFFLSAAFLLCQSGNLIDKKS